MAGLLCYRDPEFGASHASPVRSRSGNSDWELIPSSPRFPPSQSKDDGFGSEEFEVRTSSIFGSVFESSRFLQDDYFSYGCDKGDLVPIPVVMEGNMTRIDEAGLSSVCSDNTESHQRSSSSPAGLADSGVIDSSLSADEPNKKDEAVANLTFEWRRTATNICIETGPPVTQRCSHGDLVSESCCISEFPNFYINHRFASKLDAPWYDTQLKIRRMQDRYYDCPRSRRVSKGGPPAAVHDSEVFGSIMSEGTDLHAIELNNANDGCQVLLCDSWIGRQLTIWQAQLAHGNSLWSLALAAAVMGLWIVGRGWQRLQVQNQNLRSQLRAKDKKITQLMCQVLHVKDSLSKSKGTPAIRFNASSEIPQ